MFSGQGEETKFTPGKRPGQGLNIMGFIDLLVALWPGGPSTCLGAWHIVEVCNLWLAGQIPWNYWILLVDVALQCHSRSEGFSCRHFPQATETNSDCRCTSCAASERSGSNGG